jgi:hypothetical protein
MSPEKTRRIVEVLRGTDLAISEIAERFGCSKSGIVAINRRYKVREYLGLRSRWVVTSANSPPPRLRQ